MKSKKKRLVFEYDARGFGDLTLYDGDNTVDRYRCRTGSINKNGALVNAIPTGEYALIEKSVITEEVGMSVETGKPGWKARLYRDYGEEPAYTHYLIHPDGNKPGTLGCIGIQGTNAISLRHEIDAAIEQQGKVAVQVINRNWV